MESQRKIDQLPSSLDAVDPSCTHAGYSRINAEEVNAACTAFLRSRGLRTESLSQRNTREIQEYKTRKANKL